MNKRTRLVLGCVSVAAASVTGAAHATEGGASTYAGGVENWLTGAAPPPGFHVLEYVNVYRADRVKGNDGKTVTPPGFSLDARVAATRLVWSTRYELLGGNLLVHAIVPLVNLDVDTGARSQSHTGLGDVTFGPAIGFHHSESLHSVVALDIVAPTGGWKRDDLANLGNNHWSVQPVYTVSRIDPAGFNGDFKAVLNLNARNDDTRYRSGTEFYLDYSAGWAVAPGWVAGVGGYAMRQLSDDKLDGAAVSGSRARALAVGPSMLWHPQPGWFVTAKLTWETAVRNRPEGTAFWLKTVIPF